MSSSQEEFNQAAVKVHPVETQWHYKFLIAAGFVPHTLSAVGFVRAYEYTHPDGRAVKCNTGANADYWTGKTPDDICNGGGYWATLEKWLKDSAVVQCYNSDTPTT